MLMLIAFGQYWMLGYNKVGMAKTEEQDSEFVLRQNKVWWLPRFS